MEKGKKNFSLWTVHITKHTNINCKVHFSNRFRNDKVYRNDEYGIAIFDGVLLNKSELLQKYKVEELDSLLKKAYQNISILAEFTGPFTGFLYNKMEHKGLTFGNQTGDASVFYRVQGDELFISNNFNALSTVGPNSLDEKAAHYLLTYGFIVDDSTIIKEVKRLRAGQYLSLSEKSLSIKRYHKIQFLDKLDITMDEACEELDKRFRKAVKRCFDKDLEYGFNTHLADLSAGLDSRMTNWVASDMGYKNIINLSYSQSRSNEQKYTEDLAKVLGNTLYFRPLDDCSFLYKPDEIISQEFAMAYYCGITGGYEFLSLIDFDKFGLEHTGQIGDAVVGKFTRSQTDERQINLDTKRNSTLLPLRFVPDTSAYTCEDEFTYYTRMAQGALATHYIRANYTYTVSPFMDIDMINFCFRLPDSLRLNHRLYWYWIDHKYPKAGKIPSSRKRPQNKINSFIYRGTNKAWRESMTFLHYFHITRSSVSSNNMNPHTFWYETKAELRDFINNYYNNHINLTKNYPCLYEEILKMSHSRIALDKLMGVSLLAAIKQYIKK